MNKNREKSSKGCVLFASPRLSLREFCQNDLDAFLAYEQQPKMLLFENGIVDSDAAQSYLNQAIHSAKETPRLNYYLGIITPSGNQLIGRISLTIQNSSIQEWEIGWAIRSEDWGKGYASEAARLILNFAFRNLKAHRVVAFCHAENIGSAKVMEKVGMKREGYLRQTRWLYGKWADEYVYAILDSDFPGKEK
jgi:RimJ/RimL family protein N-acetyltransferase